MLATKVLEGLPNETESRILACAQYGNNELLDWTFIDVVALDMCWDRKASLKQVSVITDIARYIPTASPPLRATKSRPLIREAVYRCGGLVRVSCLSKNCHGGLCPPIHQRCYHVCMSGRRQHQQAGLSDNARKKSGPFPPPESLS
jgi:hypothetical protein